MYENLGFLGFQLLDVWTTEKKPPSCESVDIAWIAWKGPPQIDVIYVYMGVSLNGGTQQP